MFRRDIIRVCGRLLTLGCVLLGALGSANVRADARNVCPRASTDRASACACPEHAEIARRVSRQLGRSLREAAPSLRLESSSEQTPTGYRLTVRTEHTSGASDGTMGGGGGGSRTFEGADCSALADAAALLIALSIGTTEAPAPAPARVDELARTPNTARTRSLRGSLRAGALLDVGYLPRAGAGAELAGSISFRRSRVELTGLWLPSVRSAHADDGARVRVALWAVRASYCERLFSTREGRASLAACAGIELGRASGDGLDITAPRQKNFVWRAGWLALRASTELTRWLGLSLEPGLAVPFARSRFVSSDADGAARAVLHTPKPVAARVALSLEALF